MGVDGRTIDVQARLRTRRRGTLGGGAVERRQQRIHLRQGKIPPAAVPEHRPVGLVQMVAGAGDVIGGDAEHLLADPVRVQDERDAVQRQGQADLGHRRGQHQIAIVFLTRPGRTRKIGRRQVAQRQGADMGDAGNCPQDRQVGLEVRHLAVLIGGCVKKALRRREDIGPGGTLVRFAAAVLLPAQDRRDVVVDFGRDPLGPGGCGDLHLAFQRRLAPSGDADPPQVAGERAMPVEGRARLAAGPPFQRLGVRGARIDGRNDGEGVEPLPRHARDQHPADLGRGGDLRREVEIGDRLARQHARRIEKREALEVEPPARAGQQVADRVAGLIGDLGEAEAGLFQQGDAGIVQVEIGPDPARRGLGMADRPLAQQRELEGLGVGVGHSSPASRSPSPREPSIAVSNHNRVR